MPFLFYLSLAAAISMMLSAATPELRFDTLDRDEDGRLSRLEVTQAGELAGRFSYVDSDNDGYVSRDEMAKATRAKGKAAEDSLF